MEHLYSPFINLVLIGIIALFPVVNPVGSAFMVSPYFEHLSSAEKRRAVSAITLYAFSLCIISLFIGQWILQLFGISIPIIQIAGGTMICKMGWEFLASDREINDPSEQKTGLNDSNYDNIAGKLFYPITFPTTTGAGTISVLFTLSAHGATFGSHDYIINTAAILISIVVICLMIYIFYLNTKTIVQYLGKNGENVVNRISAFLIFCVGLQIGITGLKAIFLV